MRADLAKHLQQEELDFDYVLRLAAKIGRSDPNAVRFSTDAAIVKRLGRELVSKQETALAELVKNAYDADATMVALSFKHAQVAAGTLEILDDGNGMTRNELIDAFMRLSTDEKLRHPVSPRFKRDRAGEKGIGRFAAERLGGRLLLTTKVTKAQRALRLLVDWNRYSPGTDIVTVGNKVEEDRVRVSSWHKASY